MEKIFDADFFKYMSDKYKLTKKELMDIYKSFWLFVNKTASSLPLKKSLTPDEFFNLRKHFNVVGLGKFVVPAKRYFTIKYTYDQHKKQIQDDKNKKDNPAI